jgi:hypothetical protein
MEIGLLTVTRPDQEPLSLLVYIKKYLPGVTPWPLVRKRTIPIEQSPLVDEI